MLHRDFADKSWLISASRRGLPHDIAARVVFWLVMLCVALDKEPLLDAALAAMLP